MLSGASHVGGPWKARPTTLPVALHLAEDAIGLGEEGAAEGGLAGAGAPVAYLTTENRTIRRLPTRMMKFRSGLRAVGSLVGRGRQQAAPGPGMLT